MDVHCNTFNHQMALPMSYIYTLVVPILPIAKFPMSSRHKINPFPPAWIPCRTLYQFSLSHVADIPRKLSKAETAATFCLRGDRERGGGPGSKSGGEARRGGRAMPKEASSPTTTPDSSQRPQQRQAANGKANRVTFANAVGSGSGGGGSGNKGIYRATAAQCFSENWAPKSFHSPRVGDSGETEILYRGVKNGLYQPGVVSSQNLSLMSRKTCVPHFSP